MTKLAEVGIRNETRTTEEVDRELAEARVEFGFEHSICFVHEGSVTEWLTFEAGKGEWRMVQDYLLGSSVFVRDEALSANLSEFIETLRKSSRRE